MKKASKVKCPTCKRPGDWFAGPYGPFCSKRCKLVDLGKWLGEEYRVPVRAAQEDDGEVPLAPGPEPEGGGGRHDA